MTRGPLPPHERAWRHPSELAAPPHEPTSRGGRVLIASTATVSLLLVGFLALSMTPDRVRAPEQALIATTLVVLAPGSASADGSVGVAVLSVADGSGRATSTVSNPSAPPLATAERRTSAVAATATTTTAQDVGGGVVPIFTPAPSPVTAPATAPATADDAAPDSIVARPTTTAPSEPRVTTVATLPITDEPFPAASTPPPSAGAEDVPFGVTESSEPLALFAASGSRASTSSTSSTSSSSTSTSSSTTSSSTTAPPPSTTTPSGTTAAAPPTSSLGSIKQLGG